MLHVTDGRAQFRTTCTGSGDVHRYYTFLVMFQVYLKMPKCHSCKGNLTKIYYMGALPQCVSKKKNPFCWTKWAQEVLPQTCYLIVTLLFSALNEKLHVYKIILLKTAVLIFSMPCCWWPLIKTEAIITMVGVVVPLLRVVRTQSSPLVVKHSLLTHIMTGCWIVLTPLLRPQLTRNTLGWSHKKSHICLHQQAGASQSHAALLYMQSPWSSIHFILRSQMFQNKGNW